MPRGLALLTGSERCLLSHPDSPPPQTILEIRLRGSGLSVHGFGLSLAPCTFTKCMDVALPHLRQMIIHILNYLDDWLVLTHSEADLISHRTLLLSHLEYLGLRVNFAKSMLSPSQRISFLGTVLDSAQMRAVVTPERAWAIKKLAPSFEISAAHPLKAFQKMLGLIATASPALQLGLLHIWGVNRMVHHDTIRYRFSYPAIRYLPIPQKIL